LLGGKALIKQIFIELRNSRKLKPV
jgi:hypothetical protein